jgi:hypothetical protein
MSELITFELDSSNFICEALSEPLRKHRFGEVLKFSIPADVLLEGFKTIENLNRIASSLSLVCKLENQPENQPENKQTAKPYMLIFPRHENVHFAVYDDNEGLTYFAEYGDISEILNEIKLCQVK